MPAEPHYRVSPDPGNHTRLQLAVLFNDYYEVEEGGRPDGLDVVYTASDKMKDCKHGEQVYLCDVIWETPAYEGADSAFRDQPFPYTVNSAFNNTPGTLKIVSLHPNIVIKE